MKLANKILSSHAKIDVLRVIYFKGDGVSGRKISQLGEINPRSCQLALKELVAMNLLIKKGSFNQYTFHFNKDHLLYKEVVTPLFEGERRASRIIAEEIINILKDYEDFIVGIWTFEIRKKGGRNYGVIVIMREDWVIDEKVKPKKENEIKKKIEALVGLKANIELMRIGELRNARKVKTLLKGAVLKVIFGESPENVAKDLGIKDRSVQHMLSYSLKLY